MRPPDPSAPVPRPHGPPTRRRSGSIRVAGGTIRTTRWGTYMAYCYPHGVVKRRCFPTFAAAERWIDQTCADAPLPPLTGGEYADAQAALHLLPPGISLLDAARDFVRAHGGSALRPVRLSEAIQVFLEERAVALSALARTTYRQIFFAFARSLGGGDPLISSISGAQLEPFVASTCGSTRNTRIARLSPLFAFAAKKGWIAANPCAQLERARHVAAPIGVFTPEEVARLMAAAELVAPKCVPYLAVGFFAGVRPEELRRLTPECFRAGYIRLDGAATKTARARTVTIRANLAAWLSAYPWRRPPSRAKTIIPNDVCGAAGVAWKNDVMRHCYATYAYEATHDAAAVAAEMGHRGTAVFFTHYRALAEPGDGARFFDIRPCEKPLPERVLEKNVFFEKS